MERLLVTGGSGMVAQHVGEAALARGCTVVLADRDWPSGRDWVENVERVTFDVRDLDACRAHMTGIDAVVHCAAVVGPARSRLDPMVTLAVNVDGSANLLEAAYAVGARLLNVSTATLYGNRPDLAPLDETDQPQPLTVYDGTKLMAEVWCAAHRRTFGSDVASFRTGFVYGRGSQIGEYLLPKVLAGEAVSEAGADHPCDFTYVVDLAEALVIAALAPRIASNVYNVTGGVLRLRRELAGAVRALVPDARIEQAPGIDGERHLRGPARLDRALADFGWRPRFSLEQGIADWHQRICAERRLQADNCNA